MSHGRTLADFRQQFQSALGVAERQDAGFHGHADCGAHLDGIHAEVVVHAVHVCNGVEVVDSAVGTVCPNCLVLGTLGYVFTLLVDIDS